MGSFVVRFLVSFCAVDFRSNFLIWGQSSQPVPRLRTPHSLQTTIGAMAKSLADDLLSLTTPTPQDFDPEDAFSTTSCKSQKDPQLQSSVVPRT